MEEKDYKELRDMHVHRYASDTLEERGKKKLLVIETWNSDQNNRKQRR